MAKNTYKQDEILPGQACQLLGFVLESKDKNTVFFHGCIVEEAKEGKYD